MISAIWHRFPWLSPITPSANPTFPLDLANYALTGTHVKGNPGNVSKCILDLNHFALAIVSARPKRG